MFICSISYVQELFILKDAVFEPVFLHAHFLREKMP
jgi:hypothetical protein